MPLLFSYGTLQQESVQLSVFGRLLDGRRDELVGFEQSRLKVGHLIVRFNGKPDSRVGGTAFEVSQSELNLADRYEPPDYKRISTILASGEEAWVYADARSSYDPHR